MTMIPLTSEESAGLDTEWPEQRVDPDPTPPPPEPDTLDLRPNRRRADTLCGTH